MSKQKQQLRAFFAALLLAALFMLPATSHAQSELTVFVTSTSYTPAQIGGEGQADAICQERAEAGGLDGIFRAWISTDATTTEPRDRFYQGSVPYVLTDGTQIAANWADLIDGTLDAGISRNENDVAVSANQHVWTNTTTLGARLEGNSCTYWTNSSGIASYGLTGQTSSTWTDSDPASDSCSTSNRLYCFQQEDYTPPSAHKRVFLTSSTYNPEDEFTGHGDADAACQAEADAANLDGTFRAWLSTGSAATQPSNLFSQSTDPYITTKNLKIADNWTDLVDGVIDSAIVYDASGNRVSGVIHAWTNTDTDGTYFSTSTHCSDWDADGGSGQIGITGVLSAYWTNQGVDLCNVNNRFYCFEQDGLNGHVPSPLGCSNPEGTDGDMVYNGDDHVPQYCNGDGWVAMGPAGDGGAGCSNPAGNAGDMIYNDDDDVLQYCEGDEWIAIGKTL